MPSRSLGESGGPPVVPGVVERFSRWSGSSWEALSDCRDARPEVREWSVGPFEGPGVVERPSQRSGSDW